MRMWMVDPECMCFKHLLGEHVELHMILGSLKKKSFDGFVRNNCMELRKLKERHDTITQELLSRGCYLDSPLHQDETILGYLPEHIANATVDVDKSKADLLCRCEECRKKTGKLDNQYENGIILS